MKCYVTTEDPRTLKYHFKKLGKYYVINTKNIIEKFGYNVNDNLSNAAIFLINSEILSIIKSCYKRKHRKDLLFIVQEIDYPFLSKFKETMELHKIYFMEYILIDFTNKVNSNVYTHFESVI